MNVYLLLLLLFLCLLGSSLEILSGKSCRFLFIVILGLSAFIFATRNPNVVPDAEVYIYVYHRMEEANFNSWSLYNFYGFEPGYIFLNILCNKLGVTYVGFFAIVYLAQTLIAYKGMKILDSVHNNYVEKPKTFGACTFFAILCTSLWYSRGFPSHFYLLHFFHFCETYFYWRFTTKQFYIDY